MLHLPIRMLTWPAARTASRIRSVLQPAFSYIMGFASGRVDKLIINFVLIRNIKLKKNFEMMQIMKNGVFSHHHHNHYSLSHIHPSSIRQYY